MRPNYIAWHNFSVCFKEKKKFLWWSYYKKKEQSILTASCFGDEKEKVIKDFMELYKTFKYNNKLINKEYIKTLKFF